MLLRRCVLLVMFGYSDSRKQVSEIALFQNVWTLENFTSCRKEAGQDEKDGGVLEGGKAQPIAVARKVAVGRRGAAKGVRGAFFVLCKCARARVQVRREQQNTRWRRYKSG